MPSPITRMINWGRRAWPSPRAPRLDNPPATPDNAWRSPGGRAYSPDVDSPALATTHTTYEGEWSGQVFAALDERLSRQTIPPTPSRVSLRTPEDDQQVDDVLFYCSQQEFNSWLNLRVGLRDSAEEQPQEAGPSYGDETLELAAEIEDALSDDEQSELYGDQTVALAAREQSYGDETLLLAAELEAALFDEQLKKGNEVDDEPIYFAMPPTSSHVDSDSSESDEDDDELFVFNKREFYSALKMGASLRDSAEQPQEAGPSYGDETLELAAEIEDALSDDEQPQMYGDETLALAAWLDDQLVGGEDMEILVAPVKANSPVLARKKPSGGDFFRPYRRLQQLRQRIDRKLEDDPEEIRRERAAMQAAMEMDPSLLGVTLQFDSPRSPRITGSTRKRTFDEALATPVLGSVAQLPGAPRKLQKRPCRPMGAHERGEFRSAWLRAQQAYRWAEEEEHRLRVERARRSAQAAAIRRQQEKRGYILVGDVAVSTPGTKKRVREQEDVEVEEEGVLASAKRPKLSPVRPAAQPSSLVASFAPTRAQVDDWVSSLRASAAAKAKRIADRAKQSAVQKAKDLAQRAKRSAANAGRLLLANTEQDRFERDLQLEIWKDNFRSWRGYWGV
jgi:hypothetical protein